MKLLVVLLLVYPALVISGKLEDDYYKTVSLSDGAYCFTLLNGTHQFGCSSSSHASQGVLVKITTKNDLDEINSCWRNRFNGYNGKYYLYMDNTLMTQDAVSKIKKSKCIRGILLYLDTNSTVSTSSRMSADSSCPNENGGYYKDGCGGKNWNENFAVTPEGLMQTLWNIQIVFISDNDVKHDINKCIDLFNTPKDKKAQVNYPFCATSLDNKQFAAGNSEICIRRSQPDAMMLDLRLEGSVHYCDPLSGSNVYVFVPPPVQKRGDVAIKRGYLLLSARMDSFGLIPAVSPGDFSIFTSLITLLATSKAMGTNWDAFEAAANRTHKHILFTFFNGESFDYIGSSHLMYQIKEGLFPNYGRNEKYNNLMAKMSPEEIEAIIEPQQIGLPGKLNVLMDTNDSKLPSAAPLLKSLQANSSISTSFGRMPPSSWHHFKKINKDGVGMVIAPYDQSGYNYGLINSIMDHRTWTRKERADIEARIVQASEAILQASADYIGIQPATSSDFSIDSSFVHDLVDCLIVANYNCSMLEKMQNRSAGALPYKSTYVGVLHDTNTAQPVIYPIAMYAIGSKSDTKNVKDKEQCHDIEDKQQIYTYTWMGDYKTNKSFCYRHTVTRTLVRSPAFIIDGYDMKSGEYSTFTESVYNEIKMKIFLIENNNFEIYMFSIGILLALLSFLVIYRCEEKTFVFDEGEPAAENGEPL